MVLGEGRPHAIPAHLPKRQAQRGIGDEAPEHGHQPADVAAGDQETGRGRDDLPHPAYVVPDDRTSCRRRFHRRPGNPLPVGREDDDVRRAQVRTHVGCPPDEPDDAGVGQGVDLLPTDGVALVLLDGADVHEPSLAP